MIAYVRKYSSVILFVAQEIPFGDIELARGPMRIVAKAVLETAHQDPDAPGVWHVPGAPTALALRQHTQAHHMCLGYALVLQKRIAQIRRDSDTIEIGHIATTPEHLRFQIKGSPRWIRIDRKFRSLPAWSAEICRLASDLNVSESDIDRLSAAALGAHDSIPGVAA